MKKLFTFFLLAVIYGCSASDMKNYLIMNGDWHSVLRKDQIYFEGNRYTFNFKNDSFKVKIKHWTDLLHYEPWNPCNHLNDVQFAAGEIYMENDKIFFNGMYTDSNYKVIDRGCFNVGKFERSYYYYAFGDSVYFSKEETRSYSSEIILKKGKDISDGLSFITNTFIHDSLNDDEKKMLVAIDSRDYGLLDTARFGLIDFNYYLLKLIQKRFIGFANIADSTLSKKYDLSIVPGNYRDVRIAAYFSLGQMQGQASRNLLSELLKRETKFLNQSAYLNLKYDPVFKSEIMNSLGKIGDEKSLAEVLKVEFTNNIPDESISRSYEINHIPNSDLMKAFAMSVARFADRKIINEDTVEPLRYIVNNSKDIVALRNAAYAFWRIGDRNLLENVREEIYKLNHSSDAQTRMWAVNALSKLQDTIFLNFLNNFFKSERDWRVKVNMLNALTGYELESIDNINQLLSIFRSAISDKNEHVTLTGLNVFWKMYSSINDTRKKSLFDELMSELTFKPDSVQYEQWNQINSSVNEVGKTEITNSKFSVMPLKDYDWDYLEGLSQKKTVVIKTNKGDIRIELFPEYAPFTVMNFLKLSERDYYDSNSFHRVVSNFVIQSGDPNGTGGPGYSIRSEFSPVSFERGSVAMYSNEKDSEGSQFFITHSTIPQLDGKYTIFGKVIEGMEVVDRIMIGDKIEDVIIIQQ
ncbi:MAG: peptidylprolyl isomerase [Ignavibacteria bacterium]